MTIFSFLIPLFLSSPANGMSLRHLDFQISLQRPLFPTHTFPSNYTDSHEHWPPFEAPQSTPRPSQSTSTNSRYRIANRAACKSIRRTYIALDSFSSTPLHPTTPPIFPIPDHYPIANQAACQNRTQIFPSSLQRKQYYTPMRKTQAW